jgi:IclR family mhp operon transcriptional activator
MEVIETNSPVAFVSHFPLGPVGFRINWLRSATGSAYLAYCSDGERAAILARLQASAHPGDAVARDEKWVARRLAGVLERGYGHRDPAWGGHFDKSRREFDDGRDSIATPIAVGDRVLGCVNLTWSTRVADLQSIATRHLGELRDATNAIAEAMSEDLPAPGPR